MKCVICHSEDIEVKKIKEEIKIGNDIIFVPIEIPVCNSCGERYYERKTLQKLEEIEFRLKNKEINVKEVGKVLTV
jgi:YgiT-type zinc finger domain-containing protein